jgi:hypothetical protein
MAIINKYRHFMFVPSGDAGACPCVVPDLLDIT